MDDHIIETKAITKDFPGVRALDGISLSVKRGEIHALCGENGAGKSTLIKILCGFYPTGTYNGEFFFDGKPQHFRKIKDSENIGISVIHQELSLVDEMTVIENMFLGDEITTNGWIMQDEMVHRCQQILKELGIEIDPYAKVKDLGVSFQQIIEIAKALLRNTKLLILDEPTAALTEEESLLLRKLLCELKAKGITSIYISHKLEEVLQIADRITVLRDGKTVGTIDRNEASEPKIIAMMVGRELTDRFPKEERNIREDIFEINNLTLYDTNNSGKVRVQASFKVKSGEILGIAGLMGAGRTELAAGIFGAYKGKVEGDIFVNNEKAKINSPRDAIDNGIFLIPEDRKGYGLILMQTVRENLTLPSLGDIAKGLFIDEAEEINKSNEMVGELGIKAASLESRVENLSGGNQQKVVVGKGLLKNPKVFLLDEPTRGIDVGAKYEIYKLMNQLSGKGKAIVMISSELPELLAMSDRILVMCEGRITGEFVKKDATQEKIMYCATRGI